MGGVDVGEGGGKHKRSMNADINMIPFIDLLLVTVAFLLITAVWVTNSRINANAQVPGPPNPTETPTQVPQEKVLNVTVDQDKFTLAWKTGNDVVSTLDVDRPHDVGGPGEMVKYTCAEQKENPVPAGPYKCLGHAIVKEWENNGSHKEAADPKLDQAILHTDNATPFREIVGVLDAIYSAYRPMVVDQSGQVKQVPAFNMTFSVR